MCAFTEVIKLQMTSPRFHKIQAMLFADFDEIIKQLSLARKLKNFLAL